MDINFLNEKGNVKTSVRKQMRDQILDKLNCGLQGFKGDIIKNAKNCISLCLGNDILTGQPVYAHIELTLNMVEPDKIRQLNLNTGAKIMDTYILAAIIAAIQAITQNSQNSSNLDSSNYAEPEFNLEDLFSDTEILDSSDDSYKAFQLYSFFAS